MALTDAEILAWWIKPYRSRQEAGIEKRQKTTVSEEYRLTKSVQWNSPDWTEAKDACLTFGTFGHI